MARSVQTYDELFQQRIMIALQNHNDLLYSRLFREWLDRIPEFGCERCHKVFTPDIDTLREGDPVLCASCAKKEAR
jgi:hypothetical protein